MTVVEEFALAAGTAASCRGLGIARAAVYRRRLRHVRPTRRPRPKPGRSLAAAERHAVLDVLHVGRFADKAPPEIYATLLDEGVYLCSIRTMYRVLAEHSEVRERRDQLRHPQYRKPELLATRPNEVWSWDITKLAGPAKWTYFYLYVILDIFSRYVVGWMVAHRESAELARRLLDETCEKQEIVSGQLTIHADRGPSMRSGTVAMLLGELGVTKTHSRPHVSNDNPFSEAHFKTLKYRPEFPRRFGAIEDCRAFCQPFFGWYNGEHRHWGIGLMTPEAVHYGRGREVQSVRQAALLAAYATRPERFVHGPPRPPELPELVWINPPTRSTAAVSSVGGCQRPSELAIVDPGPS